MCLHNTRNMRGAGGVAYLRVSVYDHKMGCQHPCVLRSLPSGAKVPRGVARITRVVAHLRWSCHLEAVGLVLVGCIDVGSGRPFQRHDVAAQPLRLYRLHGCIELRYEMDE